MGALASPLPADCRSQFSDVDMSGDLGLRVTACVLLVTPSQRPVLVAVKPIQVVRWEMFWKY
jgi:hypothetical protein